MGRIIVSEFMTLDGVVEAPENWSGEYWGDDISAMKDEEMFATDAILLGRKTYEAFAEAWPGRTDETGYADRINSLPKHVVTESGGKLEWNNSSAITENIEQEIAALKKKYEKDIVVFGSAQLVQTLIANDLVDEYRILQYPLILGKGKKLFAEGTESKLKLKKSVSYDSGVVLLNYER